MRDPGLPDATLPAPDVDRCVVVVPARDEERTVAAAVGSVLAAAAALGPTAPHVEVVVVADACTDGTADVARGAGAHVVEVAGANVGAARRAGCAWALVREEVDRLWIAVTDADCVVPADWLAVQLQAAARADVFLGTIVLDPHDTARNAVWWSRYLTGSAGPAHRHVHGANLGVRGSAYQAAGGFHELAAHEDTDLVSRLLAAGAVVERSHLGAVTTSGRHTSRVAEGVGPDLAASAPPSCA